MPPPVFNPEKWERTKKMQMQQNEMLPMHTMMGWTTVPNMTTGGSLTTRCIRSTGWETPFECEEERKPALSISRFAPTPMLNERYDPYSSKYSSAALTERSTFKDATAKAWLNQAAQRCPFATDRRYVAGRWLYQTSYLYKSEPIVDRRYLDMHTRRPITGSRQIVYKSTKSTQQIARLIAQKINERVGSNAIQTRVVNKKHPLRVFMSKDLGHKQYLTASELRDALDCFNVTLQHDEIDKFMDAFAHKDRNEDGSANFDYRAFCETLLSMATAHPLGGYAGNSWGYNLGSVPIHA